MGEVNVGTPLSSFAMTSEYMFPFTLHHRLPSTHVGHWGNHHQHSTIGNSPHARLILVEIVKAWLWVIIFASRHSRMTRIFECDSLSTAFFPTHMCINIAGQRSVNVNSVHVSDTSWIAKTDSSSVGERGESHPDILHISHSRTLKTIVECVRIWNRQARFRILKLPIRMHSFEVINKMFITCCVMCLDVDGGDDGWNLGSDLENSFQRRSRWKFSRMRTISFIVRTICFTIWNHPLITHTTVPYIRDGTS